jgi:hypothetical protein
MGSKHIECPEDAAERFVKIRKSNYLAHAIREIEREIRNVKDMGYHVIIQVSEIINDSSRVYFCERGCQIFLPRECEEMDDRSIRLVLAHELGHILYNFDKLKTIRGVKSPSEDEEFFSWRFAYHLIKKRSNTYKEDIKFERYVHKVRDLKQFLEKETAKEDKKKYPNLHSNIKKFLKEQKA